MKKVSIVVGLVVTFLFIYLLQSNFFSWFNLAGVKPNLFVILVLSIGLFTGRGFGSAFGILFGLSLDFFIGKSIGISAIMLSMMVMILFSTLIYEIGTYTFNYFINSVNIELLYFIKVLIIELIFNLLITIIVYPLIIKFGYKIEENFKENKILTRYF